MNLSIYATGLLVMLALATATWLVSVLKRDASIVDSVWSVMILASALTYSLAVEPYGTRSAVVLTLALLWALRLSLYVTWRNWG
jgi:steroid 5-alpha reductase family enzyme